MTQQRHQRRRSFSAGTKTALLFGALALIGLLVALYDPRPSLRHVRVTFLSGSATGNYFATVDKLAAEISRRKGRLANVVSAGSVENVERLVADETRVMSSSHWCRMESVGRRPGTGSN